MNMPLREYYPVNRATELLGCQVGDLFHWAAIGAIKLYVQFDECKGYVHFCDGYDDLQDDFSNKLMASDDFSVVHCIFNSDCKDAEVFFKKVSPLKDSFPCVFGGFWSLPYNFYDYSLLLNVKPSLYDIWFSSGEKMFVSFECEDFINVVPDDVYIMKSDFLLLKNCSDMEELPNYYNGGVAKPEYVNKPDSISGHRTSATAINAIQVMAKKLYPKAYDSPTQLANNLAADARQQGSEVNFDVVTVRRWIKQ
ncbi:hypothetical protein FNN61_10375 [Salmonella enterica subsp. diarizonae]|nr:hypothetical protein [Salmonella enterica subsp. diarizonae]ECJ2330632.1 hypothetical protein [Salmonella enterica subsp. diarizonae]ECJ2468948.1 hypothetical protein [Salmonella enterica subsp. diarizonae]